MLTISGRGLSMHDFSTPSCPGMHNNTENVLPTPTARSWGSNGASLPEFRGLKSSVEFSPRQSWYSKPLFYHRALAGATEVSVEGCVLEVWGSERAEALLSSTKKGIAMAMVCASCSSSSIPPFFFAKDSQASATHSSIFLVAPARRVALQLDSSARVSATCVTSTSPFCQALQVLLHHWPKSSMSSSCLPQRTLQGFVVRALEYSLAKRVLASVLGTHDAVQLLHLLCCG